MVITPGLRRKDTLHEAMQYRCASLLSHGDGETVEMSAVISKVFIKLKKVIYLLNNVDGVNDLVEDRRGKKHGDMKFDFATNTAKKEQIEAAAVSKNSGSNNELMQEL